jgi:hypothetical protein
LRGPAYPTDRQTDRQTHTHTSQRASVFIGKHTGTQARRHAGPGGPEVQDGVAHGGALVLGLDDQTKACTLSRQRIRAGRVERERVRMAENARDGVEVTIHD